MQRPVLCYTFTPDDVYEAVWELQHALVDARRQDAIGDVLLVGSHAPVVTLGRRTRPEHWACDTPDLPAVSIERGGSVTYHGPGQLVIYPIFALAPGERDLHGFLRQLERAIIDILAVHDIEGTQSADGTGVWVGSRKIASIGLAVRHWVTYHGLALNVTTDLAPFTRMQPCGLPGNVMTRMADHVIQSAPALEMALISAELTARLLERLERVASGPPCPVQDAWTALKALPSTVFSSAAAEKRTGAINESL